MNRQSPSFSYYFSWISIGLITGFCLLIILGKIQLTIFGYDLGSDLGNSQNQTAKPHHSAGYSNAVSKVANAVVNIRATRFVSATTDTAGLLLLERFLGRQSPHRPKQTTKTSNGSGVIMDASGYVLTNNHVIARADLIDITLNDGRTTRAKLIGTDPETDLAVLKINLDKLSSIVDANIDQQNIGDIALAIGYPFRIGQTVTQGIISATGRKRISSNTYENFLQTDAAINPGNSGGALINTQGEMIGINSLIYTETGSFNGIGFAIPVDMARHVLEQIKRHGYVVRGWLGVEGQDLPAEILKKIGLDNISGILVTGVDTEGPGDKAGLLPGDIITHINKKPIQETTDVLDLVAKGQPGDKFEIAGIRKRESFSLEAVLGQRPVMSLNQ